MNIALTDNRQARVPYDDLREWIVEADKLGELIRAPLAKHFGITIWTPADIPDDLVYQLVKAVFENVPRLVKAASAASETLPKNVVKNTFMPFHPGAMRYYREIGISIPDSLVLCVPKT